LKNRKKHKKMTNNNIFDFLQQGIRVTVGATTVFLETLQDSQKREEALSQIQLQWNDLSTQWESKGEKTEEEARKIINNLWNKKGDNSSGYNSSQTVSTVNVSATNTDPTKTSETINSEVKDLTQKIVELREELEKLNSGENNNS
jgi:polyhydroxyalkanoate synthesis regulator phasin